MDSNELEKSTILITYSDDELNDDVKTFKRQVKKRNIQAIETNDGIIESKINAAGPEIIKDYLDQTNFSVVLLASFGFIITSYISGPIAEAGAQRYKQLSYQITKIVNKIKSKKNALFIVEVERENNFALKVCFVINTKLPKNQIEECLNLIPIAAKNINYEINKYKNEKVLLIKYNGTNWDLKDIEYLRINYGTTNLALNRATKCFGICERKYFPEKEDETEWEYLNAKIPAEAYKNALKNIIDYYQRLYTIEDIKYALHFGLIGLSFEMYESFFKAPQGNIPLPKQEEKKITGHCVTLTGYNKEGFKFANSWSEKWGNKGMGFLPYEYVEKYMIEAWGVMKFFRLRKLLRRKKIFNIKLTK